MATVKGVVLPHHKKEDGTWNVKIRVYHREKASYIETQHFVNAKQIRKDHSIKDPVILKMINPVVDGYRTKISELGAKLNLYDAGKLAKYLTNGGAISPEQINVIAFGRTRIEELKAAKRGGSAANMQTVVNSLVDYFRSEVVPVTEIRAKMLKAYEAYLRKPRTLKRYDQFKNPYYREVKGLADNGLHNHMRDLRILFNDMLEFYNDEDLEEIVIKHYPFKKYKLVDVTENEKPKLTVEQVVAIRDFVPESGTRIELARDLFMLSFYFCGMNAVDLWQLPQDDAVNRIGYKRSKTRGRRRDRAFISVYIPDEAINLYSKYAGTLQLRYSTHIILDQALSFGMRKIGTALEILNLEFYDARHAFGDWARNQCRFSMDDVGLALNHKDQSNTVTDTYVAKNWTIIDEVQDGTIQLLRDYDRKKREEMEEVQIELPAFIEDSSAGLLLEKAS